MRWLVGSSLQAAMAAALFADDGKRKLLHVGCGQADMQSAGVGV